MTYCLGLALEEGLVMAADSRTKAGIDYVTTYSKLHVFQPFDALPRFDWEAMGDASTAAVGLSQVIV